VANVALLIRVRLRQEAPKLSPGGDKFPFARPASFRAPRGGDAENETRYRAKSCDGGIKAAATVPTIIGLPERKIDDPDLAKFG
jgi:hypothetical protein